MIQWRHLYRMINQCYCTSCIFLIHQIKDKHNSVIESFHKLPYKYMQEINSSRRIETSIPNVAQYTDDLYV